MKDQEHIGEHFFDELARGLASGSVSRRKALRLMGGILIGTVVASVPGITLAQRAAEGAGACRGVSACCACRYFDETGEPIGEASCVLTSPVRCGPRVEERCHQRCEERAPAPIGITVSSQFRCEDRRRRKTVCRRDEFGPICDLRAC